MIERRSFLISCGCMVAGLATAGAGATEASATVLPIGSREADETSPDAAFRIQGWDAPESAEAADGLLWINIDRSWRTAWR